MNTITDGKWIALSILIVGLFYTYWAEIRHSNPMDGVNEIHKEIKIIRSQNGEEIQEITIE